MRCGQTIDPEVHGCLVAGVRRISLLTLRCPRQVPRPGGGETLVRELDVLEVAWGCTWDTMRSRMQV